MSNYDKDIVSTNRWAMAYYINVEKLASYTNWNGRKRIAAQDLKDYVSAWRAIDFDTKPKQVAEMKRILRAIEKKWKFTESAA